MPFARQRCAACGGALPPGALRCPVCGHAPGAEVVVEVGRSADGSRSARWALLAGVAALALVAVAVRSDGGQEAAAPTTSAPATSTTASTTSTSSTTSTTSTLPPLALGRPTGLRLIVLGPAMRTVDLDTGAVRVIPRSSDGPPPMVTSAGVVLVDGPDLRYLAAPYDGEAVPLPVSGWPAAAADDGLWVVDEGASGAVARFVALPSREVLQEVALPPGGQYVGAVDTGLVLNLHGSTYIADASGGLSRLAVGEAFAADGTTVAVLGCDERGRCQPALHDVRSRRVTPIPGDDVPGYVGGSFSPDHRWLALYGTDGSFGLRLLDLTTGESSDERDLSGQYGAYPAWSPDGQWLAWIDDRDEVVVKEIGTDGPPVVVQVGMRRLNSLAFVP